MTFQPLPPVSPILRASNSPASLSTVSRTPSVRDAAQPSRSLSHRPMSKTTYISLNVRAAIRQHADRAPGAQSYATDGNGTALTNHQFVNVLMDELAKGHEVIPMNDRCGNPCPRGCSGFNYAAGGGCPGVTSDAEAS